MVSQLPSHMADVLHVLHDRIRDVKFTKQYFLNFAGKETKEAGPLFDLAIKGGHIEKINENLYCFSYGFMYTQITLASSI